MSWTPWPDPAAVYGMSKCCSARGRSRGQRPSFKTDCFSGVPTPQHLGTESLGRARARLTSWSPKRPGRRGGTRRNGQRCRVRLSRRTATPAHRETVTAGEAAGSSQSPVTAIGKEDRRLRPRKLDATAWGWTPRPGGACRGRDPGIECGGHGIGNSHSVMFVRSGPPYGELTVSEDLWFEGPLASVLVIDPFPQAAAVTNEILSDARVEEDGALVGPTSFQFACGRLDIVPPHLHRNGRVAPAARDTIC